MLFWSCFSFIFMYSECIGIHVPSIGILTIVPPRNTSWLKYLPGFIENYTTSEIDVEYVKWIRSGGGKFIPIRYDDKWSNIKSLLPQLNGVVFQGGFGYYHPDQQYYITQNKILNFLRDFAYNNRFQNISIPLWGTCLGLEGVLSATSANYKTTLSRFDSVHLMCNVNYTKYAWKQSRVYNNAFMQRLYARLIYDYTSNGKRTYNDHSWGISPETFYNDQYLTGNFSVLGVSYDRDNKSFVSFVESKLLKLDDNGDNVQLSWYLSQFHPEHAYQFTPWIWPPDSTHTLQTIASSTYFSQFFVNECRIRNNNRMRSETFDKYILRSYVKYFIGKVAKDYPLTFTNEIYWFPQPGQDT